MHTFNPSTREAETDRSRNLKLIWSSERVLEQLRQYQEILFKRKETEPLVGWGSDSVSKMPATQTWGSQCGSPEPMLEAKHSGTCLQQQSRAEPWTSLTNLSGCTNWDSIPKNKNVKRLKKGTQSLPLTFTQTNVYTYPTHNKRKFWHNIQCCDNIYLPLPIPYLSEASLSPFAPAEAVAE